MNLSLHKWRNLLVLSGLAVIIAGCQTAAPPVAPRVASGGGDQPFFATAVPDDDAPRQSTFARVATEAGVGTSKFFSSAAEVPVKIYQRFHGSKPSDSVRKMEDDSSADNRREGINQTLQYKFSRGTAELRRYRQISQYDSIALVRETALRASNRLRDERATPVFVKALSDESPLVRLEACKALVHLPDMNAVSPLLAIVQKKDEERDVRIAAADALKHYRTLSVARALISLLDERDFGIAWQCRQTLRYFTGVDDRFDQGAWLAYLAGPDKPFG